MGCQFSAICKVVAPPVGNPLFPVTDVCWLRRRSRRNSATPAQRSRSVPLCDKNGPFVTSGHIIDEAFCRFATQLSKPLICNMLETDKRAGQNWGRGIPAIMIGYARVSTDEQNLALQLDALRSAGCGDIFQDTGSGADDCRKGLAVALARCAAADVLVVWKLDRLGRGPCLPFVGLVEALRDRDAGLRVLMTGHGATISTTRPEGRLILAVFAGLAEFERELIRERTKAGMAAAKRRSRHVRSAAQS
jgi:hypothetical protein